MAFEDADKDLMEDAIAQPASRVEVQDRGTTFRSVDEQLKGLRQAKVATDGPSNRVIRIYGRSGF